MKLFVSILAILSYPVYSCGQSYFSFVSPLLKKDVVIFDKTLIDSLNIRKITWVHFLDDDEKSDLQVNDQFVYSKISTYNFDKTGLPDSYEWTFSSLDSNGTEHNGNASSGFKPEFYVNEYSYVFNLSNELISIDISDNAHTKKIVYHYEKGVPSYYYRINYNDEITDSTFFIITADNKLTTLRKKKNDFTTSDFSPVLFCENATGKRLVIDNVPANEYIRVKLNKEPEQILIKLHDTEYLLFDL